MMNVLASKTPLKIRGLTVATAAGKPLVNDISLSVAQGEILCIVGESGSGKSLTSLAVMGLLPKGALQIASGSIEVQGAEITTMSARRMRDLRAVKVGMIFQEPMTALNPVMRAGQQVDEVLREHTNLGPSARRERILQMFREVRLPDVERVYDAFPHQMSGGQRQRVMIAMALIMEPAVLIADEPTTALDVTTQKQILRLIDELRQKHGTAVVFITHDMGVVAEIADNVLVMRSGRVVEAGSRLRVLSAPNDDYTKNLLRAVPRLVPPDRPDREGEEILSVRNVEKTYTLASGWRGKKVVKALDDVEFTLRRGRTLGIVGESGSGKSTVARCIMRLVDPSAGSIRICGSDAVAARGRELMDLRRKIQIVFQDPNRSLNPRLTVGQSIVEGPTNFGTPFAEAMREAEDLIELVGLPRDCLSRHPHQFSGGQRQRIAIARALAVKPQILIADEAVSALDVSVQGQVLELLDEVQRRLGLAILFITHDLRTAAQICDEIVVMKSGRIVEHGRTGDVLVKPRHEYTRLLVEAAPGRTWDFANFCPFETVRG